MLTEGAWVVQVHISGNRQYRRFLRSLIDRLVVFMGLIILTFLLPRSMPGDPLELLFSSDITRGITAAEVDALRIQYGLDGTLAEQFIRYLSALSRGNLGFSFHHAAPVSDLLMGAVPWTLLLIVGALPLYLPGGLAFGIEAGRRPHSLRDRMITGCIIIVASIPPFAAAVFLLLAFGVIWPIFPVGGGEPLFPPSTWPERIPEIARHAVLPTVALAFHEFARFFFLARGEAISLSARPFITNARARGVGGWPLLVHYYGRSILPMALARLGDSIATLFGAVFFVEVVFSYPGVGSLIYTAMLERDYVLLQGAMLGMAVIVLTMNWILDALASQLASRG